MKEEIWKDIPEYEGLYQISSLGRVKSLSRRKVDTWNRNRLIKEKILKQSKNRDGYLQVTLSKNNKSKTITIHVLVAIAFKGHVRNNKKRLEVDHIDNNKLNNCESNIKLVTSRENVSKDRRGTSKYIGVSWDKQMNKWRAQITLNGKHRFLGLFHNEQDASKKYQEALKNNLNVNVQH